MLQLQSSLVMNTQEGFVAFNRVSGTKVNKEHTISSIDIGDGVYAGDTMSVPQPM